MNLGATDQTPQAIEAGQTRRAGGAGGAQDDPVDALPGRRLSTAHRRLSTAHMNDDGRRSRCPLKGTFGNSIFAILCGCDHNICKILNHVRVRLVAIIELSIAAISVRIYRSNSRIVA